nr:hypothetical protein [Actinoplanes sp. DH11]
MILPKMSPRPDDRLVFRTESRRPVRRNAPESRPSLPPIAELSRHLPKIVRDPQHDRRTVTVATTPGVVGLLQHPPSRPRIIGTATDRSQVQLRGKHRRVVLPQRLPTRVGRTLQQQPCPIQITRSDERTSLFESLRQRHHPRHAAPFHPARPPLVGRQFKAV